MQPRKLIEFLSIIEKLKCNTRHSWTSSGKQESVAEHSWRAAVMALLVADEFPDVCIEKVVKMCLIHDLGEAITGDIPSFYKTKEDTKKEEQATRELLEHLPDSLSCEFKELFAEMAKLETQEAKLFKALDKLEAIASHNEADIKTWLPLEYTENLTYGTENVEYSEYLKEIKREMEKDSLRKIEEALSSPL
ncbi:MAG: HD domain-containing protein [Oscillospiraceae bacterium]|nr:HD domain-containing protein [Oscillospiraceae bacterium]